MATLVAGGYRDICWTNKEAIVPWVDQLVIPLAELRSLIVTSNDTLGHYLAQVKDMHDSVYNA